MDGTQNISNPAGPAKRGAALDAKGKARLQKAVKDFEAIFMGMMMKSMRTTIPKDDASGDSFGNDVMESLFDAEVARRMAGRSNLGLAAMLYRSVTNEPMPTTPAEASPPQALPGAGLPGGLTLPARNAAVPVAPQAPPAAATPAAAVASVPVPLPPPQAPTMAAVVSVAPALTKPATLHMAVVPKTAPSRVTHARARVPSGILTAPSTTTLDRMAAYESMIQEASAKHGVDSTMLKAVIAAESAGDRNAVSPRDAKGLMQLTDSTAADMGVRNVWNPGENIQGGAKYLQSLQQRFPGDTKAVIASYNAGPARVEKHGGVPPIPETQAYVKRVMNYIHYFEQEEASHEGR